MNKEKLPVVFK